VSTDPPDADEPVELPIDGVLDLHTFAPREIKSLIPEWIAACRARGIYELRIVHGKGTGALRRTVHALLTRHPDVLDFRLAPAERGGWGATLVRVRG
jgi:DNA-nicking Smr family endonuclease